MTRQFALLTIQSPLQTCLRQGMLHFFPMPGYTTYGPTSPAQPTHSLLVTQSKVYPMRQRLRDDYLYPFEPEDLNQSETLEGSLSIRRRTSKKRYCWVFLGYHQVVRSIITDDNANMNGLYQPTHTSLTISSKTRFGDIISILLQVRVEVELSKK